MLFLIFVVITNSLGFYISDTFEIGNRVLVEFPIILSTELNLTLDFVYKETIKRSSINNRVKEVSK